MPVPHWHKSEDASVLVLVLNYSRNGLRVPGPGCPWWRIVFYFTGIDRLHVFFILMHVIQWDIEVGDFIICVLKSFVQQFLKDPIGFGGSMVKRLRIWQHLEVIINLYQEPHPHHGPHLHLYSQSNSDSRVRIIILICSQYRCIHS